MSRHEEALRIIHGPRRPSDEDMDFLGPEFRRCECCGRAVPSREYECLACGHLVPERLCQVCGDELEDGQMLACARCEAQSEIVE